MKAEEVLKEWIAALEAAEIAVRVERLSAGTVGGLCRIEGRPVVFVDKLLPARDQLRFLAAEVAELDLSGATLPPSLREAIEKAE